MRSHPGPEIRSFCAAHLGNGALLHSIRALNVRIWDANLRRPDLIRDSFAR